MLSLNNSPNRTMMAAAILVRRAVCAPMNEPKSEERTPIAVKVRRQAGHDHEGPPRVVAVGTSVTSIGTTGRTHGDSTLARAGDERQGYAEIPGHGMSFFFCKAAMMAAPSCMPGGRRGYLFALPVDDDEGRKPP